MIVFVGRFLPISVDGQASLKSGEISTLSRISAALRSWARDCKACVTAPNSRADPLESNWFSENVIALCGGWRGARPPNYLFDPLFSLTSVGLYGALPPFGVLHRPRGDGSPAHGWLPSESRITAGGASRGRTGRPRLPGQCFLREPRGGFRFDGPGDRAGCGSVGVALMHDFRAVGLLCGPRGERYGVFMRIRYGGAGHAGSRARLRWNRLAPVVEIDTERPGIEDPEGPSPPRGSSAWEGGAPAAAPMNSARMRTSRERLRKHTGGAHCVGDRVE